MAERSEAFQSRRFSPLDMVRALHDCRELVFQLARRDWIVRYRQSYLGIVWALLPQLVTVGIFAFLAHHRVFAMGDTPMPYVIYALWSFSVWQVFAATLSGATNALASSGSLVTKIDFRKESLIIAPAGLALVDFTIRLAPLLLFFVAYDFVPAIGAVLIPLLLILVVMMALGFAFFLAPLNLVFRDVGKALNVILTFAMFLAPILYAPPARLPFSLVNWLNPFSPLLIATQDLLSGRSLQFVTPLLASSFGAIALFYFGWKFFSITIRRIVERA